MADAGVPESIIPDLTARLRSLAAGAATALSAAPEGGAAADWLHRLHLKGFVFLQFVWPFLIDVTSIYMMFNRVQSNLIIEN